MADKRVAIIDCTSTFLRSLIDAVKDNSTKSEKIIPFVFPSTATLDDIGRVEPNAIIVSGSGLSIHHKKSPKPDKAIFQQTDIPVLGICYGMQYMCHALGGVVKAGHDREHGVTEIYFNVKIDDNVKEIVPDKILPTINPNIESPLFKNFHKGARVWMSHVCQILEVPDGFVTTSLSEHLTVSSVEKDNLFGIHFHPEKRKESLKDTGSGDLVLENFIAII